MFFGTAKTPPAKVPTDKVVPLPTFDNTFMLTTFVLHSMVVFDTPLDADRLTSALSALVQRKGWEKLSARLRKNASGHLEYHVPSEFSAERRPITHTHVQHGTPISEHPIASQLPKPTANPAIVADAETFEPLYLGPDSPLKREDYLFSDKSILGLHILSFVDATIVVVNWLHIAFDAMGKRAIVDAWLLMLQGREDEIQEPVSLEADPLQVLGHKPSEAHSLADIQLGIFGQIGWALNNAYDMFIRPQKNYVLCIPGQFLRDLKAQALKELADSLPDKKDHFLTDGDILVAWLSRLTVSHYSPTSTRTVALQNVFCIRKALSGSVLPSGQPYVSNAINFFNVMLTVRDLLQKPLGYAAQRVRHAIQTQTSQGQIEAYCKMVRDTGDAKFPPFFGNMIMHQATFSNWQKAEFYNVDFSAAASTPCDRPVKPVYIQNVQGPFKFTELYLITGQDSLGNYWVSSSRVTAYWDSVRRALERGDYMFEKRS